MDNNCQSLQSLLESLARGSTQHLDSALRGVASSVIYLPISGDSKQILELECLTIPDISEEDRSLIPVFSSRELFDDWNEEGYRCLALPGSDVASTVPEDVWLVIDSGSSTEVEFSPEEVAKLLLFESDSEGEQLGVLDSDDFIADQYDISNLPPLDEIHLRIGELIAASEFVKEAYYVQIDGSYPAAMLGLLTRGLNSEDRFQLMAQIADLSKELFDFAGAIEVYDDLDSPASASWDLFSALTPFYVGELDTEESLNSQLVVEPFSFSKTEDSESEVPKTAPIEAGSPVFSRD